VRTESKNYFIQQFLARVRVVGRLARVIAVGVAHHVTQRGSGRRFLLESDADRRVYLDLLRENLALHEVLLVGYCLMSNHVHLIVIPADAEGLALSMKHTHGRYASYWNVVHSSSGHAWQGRYFSCPPDQPHLWEALRYTELNPVRAQLVTEAHAWAWSSAAAHCATVQVDAFLNMEPWQNHWTNTSWREYLAAGETERGLASIRQCTHTGRLLTLEYCQRRISLECTHRHFVGFGIQERGNLVPH
jgi:putative transposase